MNPISIRVQDGTFTVERFVPQQSNSEADLLDRVRSVPMDRWFVVPRDIDSGETLDALTMVDDNLQIRSLAMGQFQPDAMEPITIDVLGGRFLVKQLAPQPGENEQDLLIKIQSIESERWFVVLDEEAGGEPVDALALIDDNFEFQTLATGTFTGGEE